MTSSAWFEMPVVGGEMPNDRPLPKYPVVSNATLVYHGRHVYVSFKEEKDEQDAAKQPETRRLTPGEVRELDDCLPVPFLSLASHHDEDPETVGLGDIVAWFTRKIGVKECDGCRKRKRWLNRVVIWRRR